MRQPWLLLIVALGVGLAFTQKVKEGRSETVREFQPQP